MQAARMKAKLLPLLLFSLGVRLGAADAAGPAPTITWVEPGDDSVADVQKTGELGLAHLGRSFLVEIRKTLEASDAASAVSKLHLKDYKPPAAAPGKPAVTAVHRTSLFLRDPANAADAGDRAALDLIKQKTENGDDIPQLLIQKLEVPGQPVEWRVYQPLGLNQQCVMCHARRSAIDPAVRAAFKARFTGEQAADYQAVDWRGVLRISISPAKP